MSRTRFHRRLRSLVLRVLACAALVVMLLLVLTPAAMAAGPPPQGGSGGTGGTSGPGEVSGAGPGTVPEIDPASAMGALTLLGGSVLLVVDRYRRK